MALGKRYVCMYVAICLFAMADIFNCDSNETTTQDATLSGPENSSCLIGSRATFICVSPSQDCVGMSWYIGRPDTGRLTIFNELEGVYPTYRYLVENITGGCQLTIEAVLNSDSGPVECQTLIGNNSFTGSGYLTVIRPRPQNPLRQLNHSFSVVGSDATFTCTSPEEDCTGMAWYKSASQSSLDKHIQIIFHDARGIYLKGKYIVENSTGGCKLIITNVQMEDAGKVNCQLLYLRRMFTEQVFLFVTNKQQENSLLMGPQNSFRVVGSDATFTCVSPSRNCVGMTWLKRVPGTFGETIYNPDVGLFAPFRNKDKYFVENSTSGCKLTVRNAQMDDAMAYDCSLVIGRTAAQYRGTAFLIAIGARDKNPMGGPVDSSSAVGSNTTFTCFSPSKDCDGITWYKRFPGTVTDRVTVFNQRMRDKYFVQNTDGVCKLTVSNVEPNDAGPYVCQIQISNQTFEGAAKLNVSSEGATSTLQPEGTMVPLKRMGGAMKQEDGFECSGLTCKCCRNVKIQNTALSQKYCPSLTYHPHTGAVVVKVEASSHTIFKSEFSASTPIMICDDENGLTICIELYDLHVYKGTLTGCANIASQPACFRITSPHPPATSWKFKNSAASLRKFGENTVHEERKF